MVRQGRRHGGAWVGILTDELSHLERAPTCFVTVSLGSSIQGSRRWNQSQQGGGRLELDESASTTTIKLSLYLPISLTLKPAHTSPFLPPQFETDVKRALINTDCQ